ncbi:MAG: thioredoxin [Clostridia bacterium]|nr:thioredoxin [Clostridia bacterium]
MSIIHITKDNFNEIISSEKPILLDFYADWCGPCQMIAPIMQEIAEENEDIIVGKINVDEEGLLAQKFGVSSIPMLAVVKNKTITNQAVGYMPKEKILELF